MWLELTLLDSSAVKVRCDRVVAVSEYPNGSGPPLSWIHLVGLNDPITVQGATDDLTSKIEKLLQKRSA